MQGDRRGLRSQLLSSNAFRKGDTEHPSGYARLLLPLWGNGRIEMLLGAVVLDTAATKNSG
jgi:hypothetical protein